MLDHGIGGESEIGTAQTLRHVGMARVSPFT
jgi:hypothetical protein